MNRRLKMNKYRWKPSWKCFGIQYDWVVICTAWRVTIFFSSNWRSEKKKLGCCENQSRTCSSAFRFMPLCFVITRFCFVLKGWKSPLSTTWAVVSDGRRRSTESSGCSRACASPRWRRGDASRYCMRLCFLQAALIHVWLVGNGSSPHSKSKVASEEH